MFTRSDIAFDKMQYKLIRDIVMDINMDLQAKLNEDFISNLITTQ